ncbi:hypothetical protein [Janthinobacterium sp.]|uniref:hypothetical protein n=1 Tax=Janthinobacterium sp. TaxID=1871054 RepID=UPI00293D8861|nr:hypothetical protein [Janthinobacterium sp.]
MDKQRLFRTLFLAALAGPLAACVQPTPWVDAHSGEAVRRALAQQVLNPDAGAGRDPVAGLDGRSAAAALERYQKSFAEPAPHATTILIGGGGGK